MGLGVIGDIAGSIFGANGQNHAADQANAAQQAGTQAILSLGRENMGQQRDIYNANFGVLSPFISRGNVAGQNYNALLGLPSAPAMTSPLAGSGGAGGAAGGGHGYYGPSMADINAMRNDGVRGNYQAAMDQLNAWRTAHPGQDPFGTTPAPGAANAMLGPDGKPQVFGHDTVTNTNTPPGTAPGTTQPSAQDAFNTFANSAGMQFQQQQAADGLNNKYAGAGMLQSGAAMKAVPAYLQQQALQNYFMPYMSMLGGQQATGAQSASALAGVGSNFGNTASGIYGGMANAIGNGADSSANSALLRGQNNANMWNNINSSFGNALGMASMAFSDRRLKTNIEKVGEAKDGLGIYTWNWKADPHGQKVRGVIADEVKALRPHAYVENYRNGYDGVNYGALGSMS